MNNAEIAALIDKATVRVAAMTASQQLRMWYEQRRSFARGMCPSNRDYTDHCKMVDTLQPPEAQLSDAEIGLVIMGHYNGK